MSRVYEYGGNSISSIDEYLERINKMHRSPTVIRDFSESPHLHPPHNNHHLEVIHEDHQHRHQYPAPDVHWKVQLVEYEERDKNEASIDMEADGFIQRRHKSFEQCKTYKGY